MGEPSTSTLSIRMAPALSVKKFRVSGPLRSLHGGLSRNAMNRGALLHQFLEVAQNPALVSDPLGRSRPLERACRLRLPITIAPPAKYDKLRAGGSAGRS